MSARSETTKSDPKPTPLPLQAVQQAVAGVRHGVVQLIIQDGRVVQIDITEKVRLV